MYRETFCKGVRKSKNIHFLWVYDPFWKGIICCEFPGSGHRSWDYPLEKQFNGLRKAAWLLAEQTQLLAA